MFIIKPVSGVNVMDKKKLNDLALFMNRDSSAFVLKGESALALCYNLDRPTEGLEFECRPAYQTTFVRTLAEYRETHEMEVIEVEVGTSSYKVAIDLGGYEMLHVSCKYNPSHTFGKGYPVMNRIKVYPIENLLGDVLYKFSCDNRLCELSDIIFIMLNYWDSLSKEIKTRVKGMPFTKFNFRLNDLGNSLVDSYLNKDNILLGLQTLKQML